MSMSDPINHLESIQYHSEPSEVPYSPNRYLDRDFFCHLLQQGGSSTEIVFVFLQVQIILDVQNSFGLIHGQIENLFWTDITYSWQLTCSHEFRIYKSTNLFHKKYLGFFLYKVNFSLEIKNVAKTVYFKKQTLSSSFERIQGIFCKKKSWIRENMS